MTNENTANSSSLVIRSLDIGHSFHLAVGKISLAGRLKSLSEVPTAGSVSHYTLRKSAHWLNMATLCRWLPTQITLNLFLKSLRSRQSHRMLRPVICNRCDYITGKVDWGILDLLRGPWKVGEPPVWFIDQTRPQPFLSLPPHPEIK